MSLTQEYLKSVLHYEPDTGVFTRAKAVPGKPIGSVAGTPHHSGYWKICIDGRCYTGHRLAWLYVHGYMPEKPKEIDHINRVRNDNRIDNLREVDRSQNCFNRSLMRSNTSEYPGVSLNNAGMWRAVISFQGKWMELGTFNDKDVAYGAYLGARSVIKHLHGLEEL